jgi:hypothetical protein
MSENNQRPSYEVLPLDPENNPPDTIEEIEILINKLQSKSVNIKQQLEIVALREKQGLPVDYTRVKRSMFARTQTNKSISALQRIAKAKRQKTSLKPGNPFEKFFFEAAKDKLDTSTFTALMDLTFIKMRAAEKPEGE